MHGATVGKDWVGSYVFTRKNKNQKEILVPTGKKRNRRTLNGNRKVVNALVVLLRASI